MATEGGGEARERGPGGRVKNVLEKHWLSASHAAERLATKSWRVDLWPCKTGIINDLYKRGFRQRRWRDRDQDVRQ